MKVDLIGSIGDDKGGVGNYATKLYYHLKEQDIKVRKVVPQLSSPLLEATIQNFLEVPYIVFRSDADVIHLTGQEMASGLTFVPKRYLGNVVVTVHDISPYVNNYAGPISQLVSIFYCHGLKKVDKIIAISEFTKSELKEHLAIPEEAIEVVYQGVDTDYFYPREKDKKILQKYGLEQPYLLYVGSEINRKNMKGVLQKFKELQEENPELVLAKVGDAGRQKYREQTLEYMEELGLEKGEDVVFTGFVDEEHLPQIYSSAEATILWSHYEGFGRSALESAACGTEVITKNEPPMNEWLEESLFSEESRNYILEQLDIQDFDWDYCSKEISEVYKRIIDD